MIDALASPAIITKVLMPSVSTKQILSMVDTVMCPICLDMSNLFGHATSTHAMPIFVVGILRSGFVSLYDLSAL